MNIERISVIYVIPGLFGTLLPRHNLVDPDSVVLNLGGLKRTKYLKTNFEISFQLYHESFSL